MYRIPIEADNVKLQYYYFVMKTFKRKQQCFCYYF